MSSMDSEKVNISKFMSSVAHKLLDLVIETEHAIGAYRTYIYIYMIMFNSFVNFTFGHE